MSSGDIVAIGGVIALLGATVVNAYVQIRSLKAIHHTAKKVTEIDNAVNGKPPGASTMVSQVQDLHDEIDKAALLPLVRSMATMLQQLVDKG